MDSSDGEPRFFREQVMDDFLDGVERRVGGGEEWSPAVIEGDGTARHEGEEIPEDELERRWEDEAPPGALKAIDFRPPESTE